MLGKPTELAWVFRHASDLLLLRHPALETSEAFHSFPFFMGAQAIVWALPFYKMGRKYTTDEIRALISADNLAEFYNSKYWRWLSHKIIAEAHHECQMCKAEHKLTAAVLAHHIKHLREHPELAYEPSNLMALCHDCHERIHKRGIYSAHTGFFNEEKW